MSREPEIPADEVFVTNASDDGRGALLVVPVPGEPVGPEYPLERAIAYVWERDLSVAVNRDMVPHPPASWPAGVCYQAKCEQDVDEGFVTTVSLFFGQLSDALAWARSLAPLVALFLEADRPTMRGYSAGSERIHRFPLWPD